MELKVYFNFFFFSKVRKRYIPSFCNGIATAKVLDNHQTTKCSVQLISDLIYLIHYQSIIIFYRENDKDILCAAWTNISTKHFSRFDERSSASNFFKIIISILKI